MDEEEKQPSDSKEIGFEDEAGGVRKLIEELKGGLVMLGQHPVFQQGDQSNPNQIQPSRNGEMKANIVLAYRHLEDARMRIGKVMQAYQGGVSILDKK